MNRQKVLITGGTGFIGTHITPILIQNGFAVARADISSECEYENCDVSNYGSLEQIVKSFKPNIVIHCAAIKNLPACEDNKQAAFKSNVLSTEHLAKLSTEHPFKLIYISSDVVFNGQKGNYNTTDDVNPINWYGKTKVFSETIIKSIPDYAICRTALVIGPLNTQYRKILTEETHSSVLVNQTLLPQYIYTRLKSGETVELPSIYISNPTPVELLAEYITKIISNGHVGVFNTCGVDAVSRIDIANIIADTFDFDANLIIENNSMVSSLRPRDISLDVTQTLISLGVDQQKWSLQNYLSNATLYE